MRRRARCYFGVEVVFGDALFRTDQSLTIQLSRLYIYIFSIITPLFKSQQYTNQNVYIYIYR